VVTATSDGEAFTCSSPQDTQPETLAVDSEPSSMGVAGGAAALSVKGDKKKQTPVQPAKYIVQIDDDDDYDLSWLFSE